MKLAIQSKSATPIYEQLYNQIVLQILGGQVKKNECLPSIRVVAKELQISVIPVKTAYEMLEKDGYMYTIPAKGCFVAEVSGGLDEKRMHLATLQLEDACSFCKLLGLSQEQIISIIKKIY